MIDAFHVLFDWHLLMLLVLGTGLGIVIGAIPGLTATMLIALTLPLTFHMEPVAAITLLIGEYVGGISGGLITAILLRMPGTPASIVTTFDGYPMARSGRAERAIALGIMASVAGGLVSWMFLAGMSPALARFALQFGPWEYFTLVLMALVMLAALTQGSLVKGLLAAVLGMAFALPGIDNSVGRARLTFDTDFLLSGFGLLPVLIGAFAISQILRDAAAPPLKKIEVPKGRLPIHMRDLRTHGPNMLRSSLIGTWVGLLPGIGGNIAALVSYTTSKQLSRDPAKFGTGHEPGIVAGETANNAAIGGALIPLITMGIPGSVTEAILIGALTIHQLQPGPLLFQNSPEIAYGIIAAYFLANIVMLVLMWGAVRWIAQLVRIPKAGLLGVILMFCVLGSYAANSSFNDVWVMIGFGLVGLGLEAVRVPLGPFVIGFVLSPIAEEQLRASLMLSDGDWLALFDRPWAILFLILSLATLAWPPMAARLSARRRQI
ncbi:tripartite tricarboxylate transporter permease [Paracoccus seriniphilus]|uniref:Putative tricarboxylic transport membrane protein n=1 Tax=Paracoccus seriniphilus TaxID=184748 RepID=A0A239PUR1_9RHOB|nr:tripartite tricarboxylate transporter permease [Paracoccus seriniphilus]WCR15539.1 tripartite tricarboxylate transporter permease [Paracoccus seriniphilus]SNT74039.1 putative tricarboxylic transport membrane protein [Paracoccus seriniphilus]